MLKILIIVRNLPVFRIFFYFVLFLTEKNPTFIDMCIVIDKNIYVRLK